MMLKLLFLSCIFFAWLCGNATMMALYPKYFEPQATSCPAPLTYNWEEDAAQAKRALQPHEVKL